MPCKLALAAQNKRRLNCLRAALQLIAGAARRPLSLRRISEFPWAIPFPFPVSRSTVSPSLPPFLRHPRLSFGAKLFVISLLPFYSFPLAMRARGCVMFLLNSVIFGWRTKLLSSLRRSSLFLLPVRLHVVSLSAAEVITNSVNRVIYRRRERRTSGRGARPESAEL